MGTNLTFMLIMQAAASAGNASQMQAHHWHSRRQAKNAVQQLEAVVKMLQETYEAASDT